MLRRLLSSWVLHQLRRYRQLLRLKQLHLHVRRNTASVLDPVGASRNVWSCLLWRHFLCVVLAVRVGTNLAPNKNLEKRTPQDSTLLSTRVPAHRRING